MRIREPSRRPKVAAPEPKKPHAPPRRPKQRPLAKDELSDGRGSALRKQAAKVIGKKELPTGPATYTVQPGDSYHRIAQNLATQQLAAKGLTPASPGYSEAWHRLAHQLVGELMAANGGRPLRPGDQLVLPSGATPPAGPQSPGQQPSTPQSPGQIPSGPQSPGQVPPSPQTPGQVPSTPGTAEVPADAAAAFINQFAGDPNGRNGNCGFTSALMALRLLGKAGGLSGSNYEQAMLLRKLGGGGTNDSAWGTVGQVVASLNAAGAKAAALPNTWGSDKLAAVEAMKQAFLDGSQAEAFVVAGNPAMGWPDKVSYNGGHFVTVAGYDPKTNTFTVLDPVAKAPIQVTPEQLAGYLKDGNAEAGEIIQVTA